MVAEREPRILLIDELDKMNAVDMAALLTMMEGGRLVRAKRGRALDIHNPLKVIAASNRLEKLSRNCVHDSPSVSSILTAAASF